MQVTHTFMIILVVIVIAMVAVEETIRLRQLKRRNATLKWYYVYFGLKIRNPTPFGMQICTVCTCRDDQLKNVYKKFTVF